MGIEEDIKDNDADVRRLIQTAALMAGGDRGSAMALITTSAVVMLRSLKMTPDDIAGLFASASRLVSVEDSMVTVGEVVNETYRMLVGHQRRGDGHKRAAMDVVQRYRGRALHHVMNDDGSTREATPGEWLRYINARPFEPPHCILTEVSDGDGRVTRVETLFMGIDRQPKPDGPALLFETTIGGQVRTEDHERLTKELTATERHYPDAASARAGHDRIVGILKSIMTATILALVITGCVGDNRRGEPDATPDGDDVIACIDCEFGWTCGADGWRCWGGTMEPCVPHPDDPQCPAVDAEVDAAPVEPDAGCFPDAAQPLPNGEPCYIPWGLCHPIVVDCNHESYTGMCVDDGNGDDTGTCEPL